MANQLFYEDVDTGCEIPRLVKTPTTTQQVMYLSCLWMWHKIHYDKDYALSVGYPDVVVLGRMEGCFLAQMLTDWLGEQGIIRKIAYRAVQVCTVKDTLTCGGKVVRKYAQNGENRIDCELWIKNQVGDNTMTGNATLILPSKPQNN